MRRPTQRTRGPPRRTDEGQETLASFRTLAAAIHDGRDDAHDDGGHGGSGGQEDHHGTRGSREHRDLGSATVSSVARDAQPRAVPRSGTALSLSESVTRVVGEIVLYLYLVHLTFFHPLL